MPFFWFDGGTSTERQASEHGVSPTEETARMIQMGTVLRDAISVSSVIFAGSRPLSAEERTDLRKYYKKIYKKI
jgi:hypothetical protein